MLHNWLVRKAVLAMQTEKRELGILSKEEYSKEERTLYMYGDSDMERH